jgi:DNA-binding response OmpR family regulator
LENHKTVLIIDDDAYIQRVISLKLKKYGYRVATAFNGGEGLKLVESLKPDVVITDLNMPKVDGETFCRATNPLKKERSFLTIVLSARVNPQDQLWLREMEKTKFFEKPFSPSQLLAYVNAYFET